METKNWQVYYWARQNEAGDYEIRSVPASLGEHSASGGVFPKEGFEENYERVDKETWVYWRREFASCPIVPNM